MEFRGGKYALVQRQYHMNTNETRQTVKGLLRAKKLDSQGEIFCVGQRKRKPTRRITLYLLQKVNFLLINNYTLNNMFLLR